MLGFWIYSEAEITGHMNRQDMEYTKNMRSPNLFCLSNMKKDTSFIQTGKADEKFERKVRSLEHVDLRILLDIL